MRVALRTRRRVDEHDRYGYPTGRWHWGEWKYWNAWTLTRPKSA